jgi:hypothetical protein
MFASVWSITAAASMVGAGASLIMLTSSLTGIPQIQLFAWHPTMMFTAMALLGPAAALAVQARKLSSSSSTRFGLVLAHGSIQFTAAACAAAGLWAIYTNKNNFGKPHFTSRHSRLGLLALAAYAGGLGYAVTKTLTTKGTMPTWKDKLHRIGGVVAVAAGAAAVCTGIVHEKWMPPNMDFATQALIAASALFSAAIVATGYFLPASPGSGKDKDE